MKWFKKLSETITLPRVQKDIKSVQKTEGMYETIINSIHTCQPLIMVEPLHTSSTDFDSYDFVHQKFPKDQTIISKCKFDSPFSCFSVEHMDDNHQFFQEFADEALKQVLSFCKKHKLPLTSKNSLREIHDYLDGLEDIEDLEGAKRACRMCTVLCRCLFFYEISPGNFCALLLNQYTFTGTSEFSVNFLIESEFSPLLKQLVSKIHSCKTASENTRVKIKCRVNGIKVNHSVKKLIYLMNSTNYQNNPLLSCKRLDFSHRFSVRGHWRKIEENKIGKNRAGDYEVRGMTWVSEHERGDKDLPLIKKTRVVV